MKSQLRSDSINHTTSPLKSKTLTHINKVKSSDSPTINNSNHSSTQILTNDDLQNDKEPFTEEDLKINSLIEILKKKPSNRTGREFKIIGKFLQNSELMQKFNRSFQNPELIYEMINACSSCLEYQFLKEDEYLFKEGDLGDKFFIILKGSVKVVKSKQIEKTMNIIQYLDFIQKLQNQGEIQTLMKILKINKEIYNFDINITHFKDEIMNKLLLKRNIEDIFDHCELKKIFQSLNPTLFNTLYAGEEVGKNHLSLIKTNINKEINEFLVGLKINPNENMDSEKRIKTLEPFLFAIFEKGSYFGDYALENQVSERTASIIGNEETHLGFIDVKDYKSFILKNKSNMELKETEYLLYTYFNKYIDKQTFLNEYFRYFLFKEKSKGELLCEEGEKVENIYFIKEGELEYSFDGSLVKLSKCLKSISRKFNFPYNLNKSEEEFLTNFLKDKRINMNKKMKIFTVGADSAIGLADFIFKNTQIFKIKVISKTLKYYVIDSENFSKIVEKEERLTRYLESTSSNKVKANYERLAKVKDLNYDMLAQKYLETEEQLPIKRSTIKSTTQLPIINHLNNNDQRNKGLSSKKLLNIDTFSTTSNNFNPISPLTKSSTLNTKQPKTSRGVIFAINQEKMLFDSPRRDTKLGIPMKNNNSQFQINIMKTDPSNDKQKLTSKSTKKLNTINAELIGTPDKRQKTMKIISTKNLAEVISKTPKHDIQGNNEKKSSKNIIILRKSDIFNKSNDIASYLFSQNP